MKSIIETEEESERLIENDNEDDVENDVLPKQKQEIFNNNNKIKNSKKLSYRVKRDNQIINRKERAIQGVIIVLITLFICFSLLILMHIQDMNHTRFKHLSFLQHHKKEYKEIMKPDIDNNSYKYLELDNKLKVLLISDPNSKMAYASLDVKTGFWREPDEWPGLAHFLEHMEFQSTDVKLDDVLSTNGGSSNAYTSEENTNYFLNVQGSALDETLDVLSQMFVNPVFQQESVERESSAVNGEYEIDISQDAWKIQNLISLLAKDSHPISRFSIGNKESLRKEGVVQALDQFHEENYSSDIMSLVVVSDYSLEELEQMVTKKGRFASIKNKNLEKRNFKELEKPIKKEHLGDLVKLHINGEDKLLTVLTQTKEMSKEQLTYIEYLFYNLQYTQKNGFYEVLTHSDLVEDLDFSLYTNSDSFAIFAVDFQLTDKGYDKIDEVLNLYYTALQKFKEEGIDQEIYEQRQDISMLHFKYTENSGSLGEEVSSISKELNKIEDYSRILMENYQYGPYDEDAIINVVEQLSDPMNSVFIVSKNFDTKNQNDQQIKPQDQSFVQKKEYVKKKIEKSSNKKSRSQVMCHQKLLKKRCESKKQQNKIKNSEQKRTHHELFQNHKSFMKLHHKFLQKQELSKYNKLYNLHWDSQHLKQEELSKITHVNEDIFDLLQLPKENHYIPRELNLISLCKDPNIVLDLSYQLSSLLGGDGSDYNNDVQEQETHSQQENTVQDENVDVYEQKYRYRKFQNSPFQSTSSAECQLEEKLYEQQHPYPTLLQEDRRGKLFYKLDRSFEVPQSIFYSFLLSTQYVRSATNFMSLHLLNLVLENKIQKEFYEPLEAGYYIELMAMEQGLLIKVQGWSEKLSEIISKVFIALSELEVHDHELLQAKQYLQSQLSEYKTFNPLKQALSIKLKQLLEKPYFSYQQLIESLEDIDLEQVQNTKSDLLKQFKMDTLVYGNIEEKESRVLYENITGLFPGSFHSLEDDVQIHRVGNLNKKTYIHRQFTEGPEDELNNAIINYMQFGKATMRDQAVLSVYNDIANSFFFKYLRTDRELGYQAFARVVQNDCVSGLIIGLQGSKKPPHEADKIIEEGIVDFKKFIQEELTEEDFQQMELSDDIELSSQFTTMEDKAHFFFSQIASGTYIFDKEELTKQNLGTLSKSEFIHYFDRIFGENQGKLSIQIYSKVNNKNIPKEILDGEKSLSQIQPVLISQVEQLHNNEDFTCETQIFYQ